MKTKKIHQTWKSNDVENSPFKKEWSDSWIQNNPDWEYIFWTDEDLDSFVREEYPDFVDVWEEYDVAIKKADSCRYLILNKIGGLYADMDFACLKPFNSLLDNLGNKFMITTEGDPNSPETLGNSIMACEPNCPFLKDIEKGFRKARHRHVLESSACKFITKWKNDGRSDMIFSPKSDLLFPVWWAHPEKEKYKNMSLEEIKKVFPQSYATTFFTGTWLEK